MSFAKLYPYELKGHISHHGGRSSLLAPKTCPSWEFTVGLFSQSALWRDGLLTHFSGQGYAQGAPLRTIRYTHLKTDGCSSQLVGVTSVLCRQTR